MGDGHCLKHINTEDLEPHTSTNHWYTIIKKRLTIAPEEALGYNWHIRATNIAQATPPRNPLTFEYIARPDEK